MRAGRLLVLAAAAVVAAIVAGKAFGVGPWPGLAWQVASPSGDIRYTASVAGDSTTVKAVRVGDGSLVGSATFDGAYGIPAVTSAGLAGGLSPDGRMLVLAEQPTYQGLRKHSSFLVISTPRLSLTRTVTLDGEFGFDAISPDRHRLYVIQHMSSEDLVRYVVRAYDLRAGRLLAAPIVDKREPGEAMRGYPVARATAPRGTWVYTLYTQNGEGKPFVHALNAARGTAFCIDLPWPSNSGNLWNARLALENHGSRLVMRGGSGIMARVDTKTLRIVH